jgi:outer membrane protein TolC
MPGKRCLASALLLGFHLAGAGTASVGAEATLTVEDCHEKARANHPLARQYALIDTTKSLDLAMARRGYLPRLALSGKATYQSDVTSMDSLASSMPPQLASIFDAAGANKDQYQALAEISQTIWDGGAIGAQIKGIESSSRIERRKLDVDLYALNDRVDQLFFGILSLRAQLKQNEILLDQLDVNYRRVEASLRNGVASPYDLDAVRVEALSARQRSTELAANEKAYREMLAELIGEGIPEDAAFAMPEIPTPPAGPQPSSVDPGLRPEFALFEAQEKHLDSQTAAVRASNMPRLSAFFQAAYGEPGLNMFESGFTEFWIGGLRLTWSLNSLLDRKAQLDKIDAARKTVEAQKEAFVLNNGIQVARAGKDIDKLRDLLRSDDEIIALREGMRKSTEGKMDNGAATTDDVLKAIDAESLARQAKSLHEVQLAMAVYALKNALAR